MAETGNQRDLTKGEKTSTGKSHEDFSDYHRDNITAYAKYHKTLHFE